MMTFSKRGQLNIQDAQHAFIMAVIGGIVNIMLTRVQALNFTITWDVIWHKTKVVKSK